MSDAPQPPQPPGAPAAADVSEEEVDAGEDVDADDAGELEVDGEEEVDAAAFEGAGGAALAGVDYYFSSAEEEEEDWFVEHGWQDDSADEEEEEELDALDFDPEGSESDSGAPAASDWGPPGTARPAVLHEPLPTRAAAGRLFLF